MSTSFNRKKRRNQLVKRAENSQVLTKIVYKRLLEYLEELKKVILDPDISTKHKPKIFERHEKVSNLLKKPVLKPK